MCVTIAKQYLYETVYVWNIYNLFSSDLYLLTQFYFELLHRYICIITLYIYISYTVQRIFL